MNSPQKPTAEKPAAAPQSTWGRMVRPGIGIDSNDLVADSVKANLFRGAGRSYGDSALPASPESVVVFTPRADRIRFFNRETGALRAEAGLTLRTLNELFLREGWFVPVSPGTQFVTLGGMVASDIHGKNHHIDGCFGEHVRALLIRVADGRIIECTPEHEPELFWATVGGMGLTGHILEVEFTMVRIPSPWIIRESERVDGVASFITALKSSATEWPFTVGWIDCLSRGAAMGRGVLFRGRWALPHEAPAKPPPRRNAITIPIVFPEWSLNPLVVRTFNAIYYHTHRVKSRAGIVHPERFFYPLDTLREWNRIYGPRGFTQYQCIIPENGETDLTRRFFNVLTELGGASFLCVIKDCGRQGRGMLSFPKPGISIALDIPIRSNTRDIVDRLNQFVIEVGGRIYLCKDTFTRAEHFQAMEPRLEAWSHIRRKWDPEAKIRSAQSVRLFGDKP